MRRGGETLNGTLVLEEDPRVEIVPVEQAGGTLTDAQKQFRDALAQLAPVIGVPARWQFSPSTRARSGSLRYGS